MDSRKGFWYGFFANVIWGMTPLYWTMVDDVSSTVLLVHRTLWSIPFLFSVIAIQRRFTEFRRAFRSVRVIVVTAVAAVLLITNWGVWLWAITNERIVEASLGYFITPLISVALGVIILRERLRRLQWVSISIATVGVVGLTIAMGTPPWIALIIGLSFGVYGLVKNRPEIAAPVISLAGELVIMAGPTMVFLLFFMRPVGGGFGTSVGLSLFLMGTSVVTVVPLLMFGVAAKGLPLTTLGLLQYITPTLQLLLGVWIYGEPLDMDRFVWFVVVWIALAIYTYDSLTASRHDRIEPAASHQN